MFGVHAMVGVHAMTAHRVDAVPIINMDGCLRQNQRQSEAPPGAPGDILHVPSVIHRLRNFAFIQTIFPIETI
jgi:hypothetical protein